MQVLRTVNDHVLVRPMREAPLMAGIEIPTSVDEERVTTGVVAVALTSRKGAVFTEGDIVMFDALRPREVDHNGEDCLIIHADDIIAVIK